MFEQHLKTKSDLVLGAEEYVATMDIFDDVRTQFSIGSKKICEEYL